MWEGQAGDRGLDANAEKWASVILQGGPGGHRGTLACVADAYPFRLCLVQGLPRSSWGTQCPGPELVTTVPGARPPCHDPASEGLRGRCPCQPPSLPGWPRKNIEADPEGGQPQLGAKQGLGSAALVSHTAETPS